MDTRRREQLGDELYKALVNRCVVPPLKGRVAGLTIPDAYHISRRILSCRIEAGEALVGKKIGVTSAVVQQMLGVHQPDFGYLTDAMRCEGDLPISTRLIQPRAEGEIAFVLARDLSGPGVTASDVLAATRSVHPCFEVVDSRIRDWQVAIEDTIADNASSGLFAIGQGVDPSRVDFVNCRMNVFKNGHLLSTGVGAAALGSPLNSVAWLANTLGDYGVSLRVGEIILSGSLVPLEPVCGGDTMSMTIEGVGGLEVSFS